MTGTGFCARGSVGEEFYKTPKDCDGEGKENDDLLVDDIINMVALLRPPPKQLAICIQKNLSNRHLRAFYCDQNAHKMCVQFCQEISETDQINLDSFRSPPNLFAVSGGAGNVEICGKPSHKDKKHICETRK